MWLLVSAELFHSAPLGPYLLYFDLENVHTYMSKRERSYYLTVIVYAVEVTFKIEGDIFKHIIACCSLFYKGIKDSPRLRFRILPVCGVFSCLGMPGA